MKTKRLSRSRVGVVLGLTAVVGLGGCELLVDFDRSLIDAGLGDASFTDGASQPDGNGGDVTLADTSPGTDSASDSSGDGQTTDGATGDDGGDGATTDANDSGPTTDASDSGVDAADAADAADSAPLPAALGISPSSNDFMMVDGGTSSTDFIFTVTNSGGSTATGIVASFSGTNMADFSVGATNTCNVDVPALGTCMYSVKFTPSQASGTAETGTLTLTPATGTFGTATLTGTAN